MNLTLSFTDIAALSPYLTLLIGGLLLLLLETFSDNGIKKYATLVTLAIFILSFFAAIVAPNSKSELLTPWLRFDGLTRFFNILFVLIGLGVTLLSSPFFHRFKASRGEYYFLLIASVIGLMLVGASADFLTLFLGLETLSVSLYVLCGYMKKWDMSSEAAIKYFFMGAFSAAFLLYGIALIYGATGTTQFSLLLPDYQNLQGSSEKLLFLSGISLIILGLSFKAAIVPFHVWAPDVYDGATTPVTAFMAVGTKVGAFAAFARVFMDALPQFDPLWNEIAADLAYPTLVYANYVAIRQTQMRRFFAYSGISHAGFLLIPFAAGTPDSLTALLFYLVVYAFATLGAFAVFMFLDERKEGVMLSDLNGLFKRAPLLAFCLTLCLLTLAGIPPTAGFFAKFYVFKVAFQAGYYALVVIALLASVLSAYYYLRIMAVMFSDSPNEEEKIMPSLPAAIVGICAFVGLLALSFYPTPLLNILAYISR